MQTAFLPDSQKAQGYPGDGRWHHGSRLDALGVALADRCGVSSICRLTPEEQRRYRPAHVVETHKTDVYGDPDYDKICTSYIERQNGSLRQWCKWLTRLTYAFSKKWYNLKAALALQFLSHVPDAEVYTRSWHSGSGVDSRGAVSMITKSGYLAG